MENTLVTGDPVAPSSGDVIAQRVHLPTGEIPPGDGWRCLTGGPRFNLWGRLALRYEIEKEG